jgi:thioredoxin-like negative regulator of GroEL
MPVETELALRRGLAADADADAEARVDTHGLITDDDADVAIKAWLAWSVAEYSAAPTDVDPRQMAAALEAAASCLRGRWVADALDELIGRLKEHQQWCRDHAQNQLDHARIAGVGEALIVARTLAGEYREGTR